MRFDFSAIPSNAVVGCVRLTLTQSKIPPDAPATTFQLFRMKRPWTELGANWLTTDGSTLWEAAGAIGGQDVESEPSDSVAVTNLGSYSFFSTNLVRDIAGWVRDSTNNFGWMIRVVDESVAKSARRVFSREAADTNSRPALEIHFSVDGSNPCAVVVAPRMVQMKRVRDDFLFQFMAEANTGYAVERTPNLSPASWTVMTNVPASSVSGLVAISDRIGFSKAFYRVTVAPGR